jgi:hypothetical protein
MNTACGQDIECFNIKAGGTYSYHCTLKDYLEAGLHQDREAAPVFWEKQTA